METRRTSRRRLWRLIVSTGLLMALGMCAILPGWIAPHDPWEGAISRRHAPPAWSSDGSADHLLGTDHTGRDVLSRLVHGTRVLVASVLWSVLVALPVSIPVGYIIGSRASGLSRAVDQGAAWLRSIPIIVRVLILVVPIWIFARLWEVLVLVLVISFGTDDTSVVTASAALSGLLFTWVVANVVWSFRRTRTSGLADRADDRRSLGALNLPRSSIPRALLRHLPLNAAIVVCEITYLQLLEVPSHLSVGLGQQLAEGLNYVGFAYWPSLFPFLLLSVTVLSLLWVRADLRHWISSPKAELEEPSA